MRSPDGVAARRGAAMRPEARSGAVERRAPAMALAVARAAGAGEGSGGRRDAGGGRRGPGGGAEGPRRALRAGGGEEVRLPRGATWMAEAGGGGRVRPGADTSVGADLAGMIFFRVSGRGRDPKTEGCINRHRGS